MTPRIFVSGAVILAACLCIWPSLWLVFGSLAFAGMAWAGKGES